MDLAADFPGREQNFATSVLKYRHLQLFNRGKRRIFNHGLYDSEQGMEGSVHFSVENKCPPCPSVVTELDCPVAGYQAGVLS